MSIRSLSFTLALGATVAAQQPELEVQDLLLPGAARSQSDARDFVRRALPQTLGWETNRRHTVSGEGHLTRWLPDAGSDSPDSGILSEGALTSILAALRGTDEAVIGFDHIGSRMLLRTEYPEQLAAALADLRRARPPTVRVDVTLERLSGESATTVLAGSESFVHGEVRTVADVEHRSVLYDFDVEIAQSAASANPIVDDVTAGSSIVLRARPMPLHDEVVVEAVVRVAAPLPAEPIRAHAAIGPFDRVASRVDEAGFCFRVARDAPTRHEWTTLDGDRLRLTCAATWQPAAVDVGRDTKLVCSSLLGLPVLGFRSQLGGEPEEPTECTWLKDVAERTLANQDAESAMTFDLGEIDGGVLLLRGDRGRRLAQALAAQFDTALRPAQVEVEVLDLPIDAAIAARGPLPDGARLVARCSGPLLVDHPTCFASARERSFVRDWDTEVAQSARIPDPKVDMLEDGWFATIRALRAPGGAVDRLELALQVARLRELRELSTKINSAMTALASVSDDHRSPAIWLPQDELVLELPVTDSFRVAATLPLEQGAAMLRRTATTTFGPGRALVVRLRVE